jgi:2-methylcitrate dehydratase PrpD
VLWTDLLDPSGNLVQRVVSPLMNGMASGHFDFSDTHLFSALGHPESHFHMP